MVYFKTGAFWVMGLFILLGMLSKPAHSVAQGDTAAAMVAAATSVSDQAAYLLLAVRGQEQEFVVTSQCSLSSMLCPVSGECLDFVA